MTGLSVAYISQMETGARKPKHLPLLADYYGVSVHWLLTGLTNDPAALARAMEQIKGLPEDERATLKVLLESLP